ncbi:MAG TPA: polysaccharide biosynthesis tyrosine autokinase [Thermoanaerobaculia bacterium]|nr:polysaccharide biosynthesis tyrosine autokinase [Thermoanaerobaculia bacterium]
MEANAGSFSLQSMMGAMRQKGDTLDLVIYWRAIAKRKWTIISCAIAMTIAAAVIVNLQTPIYQSTVTLLIEQTKAKVAPTEEVYASVGDTREHFQTQAEILKSRALAAKLVDKLDLTRHRDFDPRQQEPSLKDKIKQYLGFEVEKQQWTEDALYKAVISSVLGRMTVEPIRLSQLIRVHFESPDPIVAAQIANAIAETYVEADAEARDIMNMRASEWLGGRLAGLKKTLEESERALQAYRERARLIETKGLAQSGAARQIDDQLTRLAAAKQRRYAAEHAYNQVKEANGQYETLPVVMRNTLVQRLKEMESEAEKKVMEMSQKLGPEHPRMIQAQAELKQARENTRREMETVAASLANEYEIARANEKALESGVATAKSTVQSINRKEFELAALERAVATNRQIYELFLNRFRETRASRDLQANAVARITDQARPGQYPVKPKKEQIISVVFVLGLLVGGLIALLLERLDNTLKSADDVEEKLGKPTLTSLPLLQGDSAKSVGQHYLKDPKSVFSEAIRTARTGVLLSAADTQQLTVLVTSSVPDEGKTAVAVNLAVAQAQNKRVLLVDADLRRPSVISTLGLDPNKPGLTNLLSGSATFAQCLQRVEGTSLYVIGTGPIPPNPLELILSKRFDALIKALAGTCDFLLVDSPPVHLVSDALVLSKLVTGVLFVVKADSTPYPLVRRCIRALDEVEAKIFGITLNQLDFKKAERYYGAYTGAYDKYGGYYSKPSKQAVPALR